MSVRDEPQITPLTNGAIDYTTVRFTPDLPRFGLVDLPSDMLSIFRRRVFEAAATVAPATVEFNGEAVPLASLADLARLYAGRELEDVEFASFSTSRWKVGACISPTGAFHAVSFVNGVATHHGGNHVSHVASPLFVELRAALAKKLKMNEEQQARALTPARLKSHLMLFVDAKVDNPEFSSQSKEALSTPPARFGGSCELTTAFVRRVAALPGLSEAVNERAYAKELSELARATRNDRGTGVNDIPKLEDAEDAGGRNAAQCTLIVTEGDSAKALAVAGLAVVGRRTYGVFPLRGKPLNVRDVSLRRTGENEELTGLMRALGLQPGMAYNDSAVLRARALIDATEQGVVTAEGAATGEAATDVAKGKTGGGELRYGRLMLMADQDTDGSHIKGLLLSMIHKFWPELLRRNFVQEFQTPLLKVRRQRDGQVVAFFSLRDFEAWRVQVGQAEELRWRAKYYKGLGTSTAQEAREYFAGLSDHRIQLEWGSERDGDLIDMAFSKDRRNDRKEWMTAGRQREQDALAAGRAAEAEPAVAAGGSWKRRSIEEFVQTDLVAHSLADLRRSVPSAIDGLKPSQRKVLHACFAKGLLPSAAEVKVAQLAGFVIEQTAYHHGEASMHQTIVNMAQDFVGANNVPLLEPCGQFGTRADGGRDAASVRYIFTRLGPLSPLLFPAADIPVLSYLEEDGELVEPSHFVPVLPVLLLNGASGIGTGWSTTFHGYNPLHVLDNVLAHAEGRAMRPMTPWAAGFTGEIEMRSGAGRGQPLVADAVGSANKFLSRGVAELTSDGVVVSELPIGTWTSGYKTWLQERLSREDVEWKSFAERHTERSVCFAFRHTPEQLRRLRAAGAPPLHEIFQLESLHQLGNMHAFNAANELCHFGSPEEIIELHADARLSLYAQRKAHTLDRLDAALAALEAKARFVSMALSGELPLFQRASRAELVAALHQANFAPHPEPTAAPRLASAAINTTGDGGAAVGEEDEGAAGGKAEFAHLLGMPVVSLTTERVAALQKQITTTADEASELRGTSELQMWTREIEAIRPALESYLNERTSSAGEPTPTSSRPKKSRAKKAAAKKK